MSTVVRVGEKGQKHFVGRRQAGALAADLGTRVAVIQALIPFALGAVRDIDISPLVRRILETTGRTGGSSSPRTA